MVFRVPFGLADDAALRVDPHLGELADPAVEGAMRQLQLEVNAVALDDLVPAHHAAGAVGHIVVTQAFVRSEERRAGKECGIRVDLGGRRRIKNKKDRYSADERAKEYTA